MRHHLALFCAMLWTVSAFPLHAQPTLVFDAQSVTAVDVTPGAEVAWIMAARKLEGFTPVIYQGPVAEPDGDGDGEVTFPLPQVRGEEPFEIPELSLWLAVDGADGTYTVATPTGDEPRLMESPLRALLSSRDGGVDAFELTGRRLLQTLLVRPGVGAWEILAADGAELDADRAADGVLTQVLEDLRPLGTADRPPERLEENDLLFFVDPEALTVSGLALADEDLGNDDSGEDVGGGAGKT